MIDAGSLLNVQLLKLPVEWVSAYPKLGGQDIYPTRE
jgi:hypothetical protein